MKNRVRNKETKLRGIVEDKDPVSCYYRLPYKACKKELFYQDEVVDFTAAAGRSFSMVYHFCPYVLDGFYHVMSSDTAYILRKLHWFCYSCKCCFYKLPDKQNDLVVMSAEFLNG